MNALAFRLKDLGKTSNLSLKLLCLSLTICMVAVGTFSFAASDSSDQFIQVSKNSDRSNSIPLSGATVSGKIHIFVPSNNVSMATYFLDTNGNRSNSVMTSGKTNAPFDFAYTNGDGTAKGYDTTQLTEGKHTLIVTVKVKNTGKYEHHTSEFVVDNVPDRNANPIIRFSKSSDRSNDSTLDLSTVSGNIYVFVEGNDIKNTAWYLDANGNYKNSNMTSGNRNAPYDLMYKESNGTAKPLNTADLSNGKHELSVRIGYKSTGQYVRYNTTFVVDNSGVMVTQPPVTKPPTTQPPVTKPPTTQPPVTVPPITSKTFAGDVGPGKVRWGAAIDANGNPVTRHGSTLGNRMGLRRTFVSSWSPSKVVSLAKEDVNAGRLPWVSNKPAGSWKSHGDGKYDSDTRQMFIDLGKLNGSVWYTFHHEPEGGGSRGNRPDDDGGPSQWLRAQERIGKILDDLQAQGIARNVAFGPVLMGYTWQKSSGRNPNEWYKPGIWDFAGIDAYTRHESSSSPMDSDGFPAARKFYGERGLKVALGEWAIRTQETGETNAGQKPTAEEERIAGERMRLAYKEMLNSHRDGKGAQIIGAAYFDTSLNSGAASYSLTGTQLSTFREIIALPTSITGRQN